jgi:protein PhnA
MTYEHAAAGPKCKCEFTYEDRSLCVCPECSHEWNAQADALEESGGRLHRDSAGNLLQDGDTVIVVKDLKLKGSSAVVKNGDQGEEHSPCR